MSLDRVSTSDELHASEAVAVAELLNLSLEILRSDARALTRAMLDAATPTIPPRDLWPDLMALAASASKLCEKMDSMIADTRGIVIRVIAVEEQAIKNRCNLTSH